jgi:hypothetical protein
MERIKDIYDKCESSVVTDGKKSESFQMFLEVRHGSVLYPMLFNMVMNEIIRRVTEEQRMDYQNLCYMQMTQLYGN